MRVIKAGLVVMGVVSAGCSADAGQMDSETGGQMESATGEQSAALNPNRLRYVERDITAPPPGYAWWTPQGVSNRGEVYGTGYDCAEICTANLVKLGTDTEFSVLLSGFSASDVNRHGDIGGCFRDSVAHTSQAAIVRRNGRVELIPPLSGEYQGCVTHLSDGKTAVVTSSLVNLEEKVYVLRDGRTYPVPFVSGVIRDLNDRGEITGAFNPKDDEDYYRAFRFDTESQTLTVLEPAPGDLESWGHAINQDGEVLGYSSVDDGIQRIGTWNENGEFETVLLEGTGEVLPLTDYLTWNEKRLIIASDDETGGKTYLIPKPGVRIDLADRVESGSVPPELFVRNINKRGDFLAFSRPTESIHLFTRTD